MTDAWIRGALKGKPFWAYVHGGRAYHARRGEGDRVAMCGTKPREGASWRGSYQLRMLAGREIWSPLRPECSRCHLLLRWYARWIDRTERGTG